MARAKRTAYSRRENTEELERTLQQLRAGVEFDQDVTINPRQAGLIILYLKVHKLVPHWW